MFLTVFGIALFGVLMLIGPLPTQPAFVCRDCCFDAGRGRARIFKILHPPTRTGAT